MSKVAKPSLKVSVLIGTVLLIVIWLGAHFVFAKRSHHVRSGSDRSGNDDEWKREKSRTMARHPGFDWKAYLELNSDLSKHFNSEQEAVRHFVKSGEKENRPYKVVPDLTTWDASLTRVRLALRKLDDRNVRVRDRTLIVYHLGAANQNNSLDVSINNMKIFTSAMLSLGSDAKHQAVYLFNVEGGSDNPLLSMIPTLPNVAIVHWEKVSSDMVTHIRTIRMLGDDIVSQFQALMFFNQGVRGPLVHRRGGGWLAEYRRLLDTNNVGMVGSTISCEITPHVQTHVFAVRSSLFLKMVDIIDHQPVASSTWLEIITQYEVGLTTTFLKAGYNVSALVYDKRLHTSIFNGTCIGKNPTYVNPTSWCDLTPEEVIFLKWGGEPLRTLGYMCEGAIERMESTLEQLAIEEPSLGLVVPEVLTGGRLYDLYREYEYETWVDRRGSVLSNKNKLTVNQDGSSNGGVQDGVCFLVRTYDSNKNKQPSTTTSTGSTAQSLPRDSLKAVVRGGRGTQLELIDYQLSDLLKSLLRQADPHWTAIIFNTDPSGPYDDTLRGTVREARDERIQFMEVPANYRPQFTPIDAGYTATDYVMSSILHQRKDCKWISVTNGDNIYGSSVVHNVRTARSPYADVTAGGEINMILNPVDSRNFADQDYVLRNERTRWDDRCVSVWAQLHLNRLAFTAQPIPVPGGMDLASVFLRREKLLEENLYFSNFTNIKKYPCAGCQDGYFTEYLVRNRLWNYMRLPIDGLRSIVFHGPSPTWCIASGNVWFDHPSVGKVGCVSHNTALALIYDTEVGGHYDPTAYFNDRVCLRFSRHGFNLAVNKV